MAEEVTLKLTVDAVGAAQSVKDLKLLIRDATNEALKFEQGSAEFTKFANIAAQAKDKLGDVREQMEALNPDAKAQSFLKLGNAIVGGFAAGQAAMALFGVEGEEVQKTLLKVQAAMGLLQGFKAIEEGAQAFTVLRGAIMTTIASVGALKVALITTGIGALIVGIGLLIAALNKADEATKLSTKALTDHEVEVGKLQAEYDKLTGKITEFEAELKSLGLTHEQVMNKLQIDAETKINAASKWYKVALDFLGNQIFHTKTSADKIKEIQKEADKEAIKELERYNLEVSNKFLESEKKKAEDEKKSNEEQLRRKIDQNTKLRAEDQKNQTDEKLFLEAHLASQGIVFDSILFKYIDFSKKVEKVLKQNEISSENAMTRLIKNEERRLKKEQELANARIQIEQSVFSALSGIGNLVIKNAEKQAAFQKKLAAVQIIISQVQALAKSVNAASDLPFPANLVAIAASIASIVGIFVGIKSIFNKAGDIGGAPSLDTGGGISAPSIAVSDNVPSGVSFLDQPNTKLGGDGSSPPPPPTPIIIENSISEYDITKTQQKVFNTQKQATID